MWRNFCLLDMRLWVLLAPALVFLFWRPEDRPVAETLLYSMAVMLVIAGMSHWVRKVMFRRFDWYEWAVAAKGHPVGAGLVTLAVSLVLCSFILGTVWWVRGGG